MLSYVVHMVTYWSYSYAWYLCNYKKLHGNYGDIGLQSLKIQTTVLPVAGYMFSRIYNPPLHSNIILLPQIMIMSIYLDIVMYHVHYMFHHKLFYKYHKLHHNWTSPVPWGSLYATVIENTLSNVVPVLSAPIVVQLDPHMLPVWIFITTLMSLLAHNGYGKHDVHHKYHKYNYGTLGLCDMIYGTGF